MDRRTLVFIFAMTASLFLMNQWFDYKKDAAPKTQLEQPLTQVDLQSKSALQKSASPSPDSEPQTTIAIAGQGAGKILSEDEIQKYSIVQLFKDLNLTDPVAFAVQQSNGYIGVASTKNMPNEIFVSNDDGNTKTVERAFLRVEPKEIGDLFFYSIYPLSKLQVPWVPNEGVYPLAFLYFDQKGVYKIDGKAFGYEKATLTQKPPKNALVLFEFDSRIDPLALYNPNTNKLSYIDHLPVFSNFTILGYPESSQLAQEYRNQKYYVLENDYLQLVFSNINGSLAEINLPFASKQHPKSIVKEIEIDRIIEKDYPINATFPQYRYLVPETDQEQDPKHGGYYPLLRRNIIGSAGDTTTRINPHYYAFNVFERDFSPDDYEYKVTRFEKDLIEFQLSGQNRRITKTFSFPKEGDKAPYAIDLTVKIEGDSRDLFISVGIPEVEFTSGSTFDPTLKYRLTRNQKGKVEKLKPPKQFVSYSQITADWYTDGNAFFGIIFDPLTTSPQGFAIHPVPGEIVPSRITFIDAQFNRYPADKYPGYAMHIPLSSKAGTAKYRIYTGPYDKNTLDLIDTTYADKATGYNPDYVGAKSYHGWFAFISQPFGKFLFILLNFFHKVTNSWGFAIIFLTIFLRLLLYPLNNWAMKSTAKSQKLQPKIKEIQEKYKKDPKRSQMEVMALYKKEGANPFMGCFPMLIQLPFILGLLEVLKSSFALRGAPFIPGWIDNLTAPDVLFSWSYPIPFIGTQFHLLPVLLGVIMYFQQKLMSPSAASSATTDQAKQQKSMGNIMTVVFTVLFYNFPSGLNIYWICSMLLGILQQWIINKQIKAKG